MQMEHQITALRLSSFGMMNPEQIRILTNTLDIQTPAEKVFEPQKYT